MTRILAFLLALQVLVQAQIDLGPQDDEDLGPYTLPFCDIEQCKSACDGGADLTYVLDPKDQFPDVRLSMSVEELQRYQSLQQEYIVQFSENPLDYESKIDLPNCGIANDSSSRLLKRDTSFESWEQEITAYRETKDSAKPACLPTKINAKISFNIVTSNYSTNYLVTEDVIDEQFNQVVQAYKPLGIHFEKGVTIRWSQPEWRNIAQSVTSQTVDDLRSVIGGIRRGGFDQINVFIVERVEEVRCEGSNLIRTDGFCTYPDAKDPQSDGCFIDIDSMPGMAWRGTEEGDGSTLVHEIGHWFGLRHVYESNSTTQSCQAPDSTYVDTPAFAGPGSADPFQLTCCADSTGKYNECDESTHHVTNWMSYSHDRGMVDTANASFPWTRGQRAAMFANFFHFRRDTNKTQCDNGKQMYPSGEAQSKRSVFKRDNVTALAAELLAQPIHLLDTLKSVCSNSYNGTNALIDSVTGLIKSDVASTSNSTVPAEQQKNESGWDKLGVGRWVIIAAAAVVFLAALLLGVLCLLRRRKAAKSYVPIGEQEQEHEMQRRGLKDIILVQSRTAQPSAEPMRGDPPPYEDGP